MECERCGVVEDTKAMQKYFGRTEKALCESCRFTRRNKIKNADGSVCHPWHGVFDDDDNPLDDQGNIYLDGVRVCRHKDCVNPEHIVGNPKPPERKRGRPARVLDEDVVLVKNIIERKSLG